MSFTAAELDLGWSLLMASPCDVGRVLQVCVRPDMDQRAFPEMVELCPKRGAVGDRWEHRTWMYLADGTPDPRVQIAMVNSRTLDFLQSITGSSHHPGDTFVVDFDLSMKNVPAGSRLLVGEALIEVSDVDNDGCAKFAKHYGADVLAWIRDPANRNRRLRGLFARIIVGGPVRGGSSVRLLNARE